jgi:hypothetical protein
LFAVAACSKHQAPAPGRNPAKKEHRALVKRVRAIDDALAQGGLAQSPEFVVPLLTQWALQEFSARIPAATRTESTLRFVGLGIAEMSIIYSVPESAALRTQTIEFVFENKQWNMFWKAESPTEISPQGPPSAAKGPSWP